MFEVENYFRKYHIFNEVTRGIERYCMSALKRLSEHVMTAQDTGSFLSLTFGTILVQVKRNFDKYMLAQEKSITDSRLPKKSKCGIVPFVANFEVSKAFSAVSHVPAFSSV